MRLRCSLLQGLAGATALLCVASASVNAGAARRPSGQPDRARSGPAAALELLRGGLSTLPPDLDSRPMQPHKPPVDVRALLSQAALPHVGGLWYVALPTLARLTLWDVPRPHIGQRIGVLGEPRPPARGTPALTATILFIGGRGYPLQSEPA